MGTDCKLVCDGEYFSLDRWYVFSPKIESMREMTKSEALKLIRDLCRTETLKREVALWGDRADEFFKYHRHWLMEARKIIKSCNPNIVVFLSEHDLPDNYYIDTYKRENNAREFNEQQPQGDQR